MLLDAGTEHRYTTGRRTGKGTRMTRAIVFDEYGGPDVLRLAELPDPVLG